MKIGVIGYGYWGPNLLRNLAETPATEVRWCADTRAERRAVAKKRYPTLRVTSDVEDLFTDRELDAVAIATPVHTHFHLAKRALEQGKHVFIEKPMTATVEESEELVALAAKKGLILMVDHTFIYTGAVRKTKELLEAGEIGDLYYFDSMRVNLGLFQHDIDVLWDLAPHDLSIMDYLIGKEPEAVVATGQAHLNAHADVAYMTVYFPQNTIAHINVNWLSPVKVRTTLIGGEKKMLVWNDLEADEKVKVYDKGVQMTSREGVYKLLVSYRSGDMWAPKIEQTEALKVELAYFLDCIENNQTPINDGVAGLRVIKLLEAATESLKLRGEFVSV